MILEVFYQDDSRVGRLADEPGSGRIFFQYDADWTRRGIELSPFHLPVAEAGLLVNAAPGFQGLPGVFHDSLPDYWGTLLLDARLRAAGLDPERVSPLVRLSYIGSRGMGALGYRPEAESDQPGFFEAVSLAQVDRESGRVLEGKTGHSQEMLALLESGCSAGGAKPKVLVAMRGDQMVIGGGVAPGHQGWLIKLSNVPSGHKDSKQEGRVEYANSLMARAAGIAMPPPRLFEIPSAKGPRGLFGVQRFDRGGPKKIHAHSLAGLLQIDFRAITCTYEDFAKAALELSGDFRQVEEIFRRLAFNVITGNCDDHAKNAAFLLDSRGEWKLSPAFDLTHSPGMNRLGAHAMSVHGSRTPGLKDLEAFAASFGVASWKAILDEVKAAARKWPRFAGDAGVRAPLTKRLGDEFAVSVKNL